MSALVTLSIMLQEAIEQWILDTRNLLRESCLYEKYNQNVVRTLSTAEDTGKHRVC